MPNITDEQLVNQYLKGDEESLEILIKQYLKPIYSFVYHYLGNVSDAEDVAQEVFVKMWRNLKKFDGQKKFKTWIFTIAKNTCLDYFRKKKIVPMFLLEDDDNKIDNLIDLSSQPNKIVEQLDAQQKITPVLDKLSAKHRLVLNLYYQDQLNFREIGKKLNESINTIKSRYRRALNILRKIITES